MDTYFFSERVPAPKMIADKSVSQSNLIETNPIRATHSEPKTKNGDIPAAVVFFAPMCFMIFGTFLWLLVSNFLKMTENKNGILTRDRLHQHPCRKCQFFNDNNYLKCAVHPSVTLTQQALNCSDYQPR